MVHYDNNVVLLKLLINIVCKKVSTYTNTNHYNVSECLIVSTLNILRLQLHAMTKHQVEPASVGVAGGSRLHSSLKRLVVELASSAFVLETIQAAAQATLQAGWSILLPTADERARTLSSLLSGSGEMTLKLSLY